MTMSFFSPRCFGFALLLLCGFHSHAQTPANGNFDNIGAPCAANVSSRINPFADGCIPNWFSSHGTPSIRNTGSDYYAFMYGGLYNGSVSSEGIFTSFTFQSGLQYTLTYWARNVGVQAGTPTLIINIANGLQPDFYQGTGNTPPPTAGVTRMEMARQIVTGSWVQYSVTFTAPANANQFWLYTDALYNVVTTPHQIEVNDISILGTCNSADIYYQNTSALPALTRTQGRIFAGQQVTGGPVGQVSAVNGQTVAFRSLGEIALSTGFNADPGAEFSAVMVPCRGVNYRSADGLEASTAPGTVSNAPAAAPPPKTPCECLNTASFAASTDPAESQASPVSAPRPASMVQVYPNPAHDHLAIVLPRIPLLSATGEIVGDTPVDGNLTQGIIYDAYGHEVQHVTLQPGSNTISVKELKRGIYYLHIPLAKQTVKTTFEVAP